MKPPRSSLNSYFSFSRKDRLAALGFVLVFGSLYFLPRLFPGPTQVSVVPDTLSYSQPDPEADRRPPYRDAPRYGSPNDLPDRNPPVSPPFPFNPNELDAAGWQRLGLPERVVRSILRYRDKGGRFRRPEDLQKFRALPPGFYERVATYIRAGEEGAKTQASVTAFRDDRLRGNRPASTIAPVSINSADSAAWEALPGIGATLTGRILRYRDRLGGFVSIEQLREVWGLSDSNFQKFRPYLTFTSTGDVRRIQINSASQEELRNHPYIRWKLANAIVNYRNQHGRFGSIEELKRIEIIADSTLKKLSPYISFN